MSKLSKREYVVPVKGLSTGKHKYGFTVGDEFFEDFEHSEIYGASVDIDLILDKQVNFIAVEGELSGEVTTECDRCLGDLVLDVKAPLSLLVKFTKVSEEPENEEVMTMDLSEPDLDLRQFFYDFICLAMPIQRVHSEDKCDPAMIAKLKRLQSETEKNINNDNPFEGLKDLMN